jgi:hypothetical protein
MGVGQTRNSYKTLFANPGWTKSKLREQYFKETGSEMLEWSLGYDGRDKYQQAVVNAVMNFWLS